MCRKTDYSLLSSMLMQRHLGGNVAIGDSLLHLSNVAEDLEHQINKLTFDKQQLEIRLSRAAMKCGLLEDIIEKHLTNLTKVR